MLFSESFIFTSREDPKTAECRSHKFLLKGCFLYMVSSGIYSYLPLGWRILNNINSIIRRNMDSQGAQELFMSALQPVDIWRKTGRDQDLKDVMFKFTDRKQRELCLGPTHEEEITEIVRRYISSYKQLPVLLYQIQTKFRDEPRPRFGLMRSCEFIMKDAYSFDKDEDGLGVNYEKMLSAYKNIFTSCGLNFITVQADSGAMGGDISHEFMVPSQIGEDILFRCSSCKKLFKNSGKCPECSYKTSEEKMIEIGHIFKLGTKYSRAQQGFFLDEKGERKPFDMGCYGIGVSRILSAVAETNCDDKGIIWPVSIAPFHLSLLVLDDSLMKEALEIRDILESEGHSVLVDDRPQAPGVKFNDSYLIGSPYIAIVGKKYRDTHKIELEVRAGKKKFEFGKEELFSFLRNTCYGQEER